MASQAAASGGFTNAIVAFGVAAGTLVLVLVGFAAGLANLSDRRVDELRVQGSQVKRVAGCILIAIGLWFLYLAVANPTYLLA